jgi:phosphate transport system substrate-binding protein
MKIKIIVSFFVLVSLIFFGCNSSDSPSDTPTYGKIIISVDETFKPLIESEVDTFEKIYEYADVQVNYKPEADAFYDLMETDIRLIIVPRTLNKEELDVFNKWEIVPKITKIAFDGVALIGSKDLKDSTLTIKEINSLLTGKNLPGFKNTKIIFDNSKSSTIRFLKEKSGVSELSKNCFALNSNTAVIDYISAEKNSIGIIGVNWISDKDDSTRLNFLKSVKVLEISQSEDDDFYKPFQAYIAQKVYPLWREVFVISKEAYTGLGTGLTAFIASERGQRIVLKFGLVPATMPVRLVELIENEDLYIKQE